MSKATYEINIDGSPHTFVLPMIAHIRFKLYRDQVTLLVNCIRNRQIQVTGPSDKILEAYQGLSNALVEWYADNQHDETK